MDTATIIAILSMLLSNASTGAISMDELNAGVMDLRDQVEISRTIALDEKETKSRDVNSLIVTVDNPRTYVKPEIPSDLIALIKNTESKELREDMVFTFLKSEAEQGRTDLLAWSDEILRREARQELRRLKLD